MDNLWCFWSALGYLIFIQTFKHVWVRWCSCGLSFLVVLYVCGIGIHPCEACLHVCEASLTSHVTSHTGRVKARQDLDKRQHTFPRGFTPSGRAVHRRRVWSKRFSHSAGTLAREMSHPALITLSSFYLPQSSPKCTHQHKRRAWHAVHVHVSRGYRSRHGAAAIAWYFVDQLISI